MKTVALLSFLVLAGCASSGTHLDTGSYLVDLVAESGGAAMPDHLVFGPGGFESTLCREHGFQRADYTASGYGETTTFEATAHSPTFGANAWRGSIRGDSIEGTLTATDPNGMVSRYRYHGRRESGPLDGRCFHVVLVADADNSKVDDDLVFCAGSFDSSACHGYGFGAAPYAATPADAGTGFAATTTSPQNGSMAWQGSIAGDQVRGAVTWTDAKGQAHRSTFAGRARR